MLSVAGGKGEGNEINGWKGGGKAEQLPAGLHHRVGLSRALLFSVMTPLKTILSLPPSFLKRFHLCGVSRGEQDGFPVGVC